MCRLCVWVQATGRLPSQQQMTQEYIKPYDSLYGPTYTVLDILQRVFYTSNAAREVRTPPFKHIPPMNIR